jgi:multidrug efflux pump subunit AcrA (membrane-fusion protein)
MNDRLRFPIDLGPGLPPKASDSAIIGLNCDLTRLRNLQAWGLLILLAIAGCQGGGQEATQPPVEHPEAVVTNRIDIPGPVRSNLGITFARVERRAVAATIRVPGRFELLPTARAEFRTPLRGRVDVLVSQYQPVKKGDALFRLDSPDWRDLQRELSDTMGAIDIAQAQLKAIVPITEAHRLHEEGLEKNIELWSARKAKLAGLGDVVSGQAQQMAEAQSKITESSSALGELKEKEAELELRRAETESQLRTAQAKQELFYTSAAALLGVSRQQVTAPVEGLPNRPPYWQTVVEIEVRASQDGVVEQLSLTSGAWTEEGALVLSVVDPTQIRFRARGLQSDLHRLEAGLPAAIAYPFGNDAQVNEPIPTRLELGLNADPNERTIELIAKPSRLERWTRPGVSAFLEIATQATESAELAIPLSAVVRDGLTSVIFRRDPANPDKAIRLEADLGTDDGRWVVIHSGVREGDEVVLSGVYQLLLATSGAIPKGGHFHADGTFHAEAD